jgi:co-chaperonin GroES (HSP10)
VKGDALASGGKKATFFPAVSRIPAKNTAEESDTIPTVVDNSALFARQKPTVLYRGKALGKQVLVQVVERESNTLLVIPDSAKSRSDIGIVKSVGNEVTTFGEGDLILYDRFAAVGAEVSLVDESGEEKNYLLLQACDVLLQLEKIVKVDNSETA